MSTATDPIADMLSRIRNAVLAGKTSVSMPHSNIKEAVARILAENGFVHDVAVSKSGAFKTLNITINKESQNPNITEIVRLSRPGRRHYVGVNDIPVIKRGRGIVILSTSKGIMTGETAAKERVGGELICKVY